MTTAILEKNTLTNREKLENILPTFDEHQMDDLLKYAKFLQWSYVDVVTNDEDEDDDTSWADLPPTTEEEAQIAESMENFKNGECLTFEELFKNL